jgi:phage/plasmid-like protein (TIGR03299 family)
MAHEIEIVNGVKHMAYNGEKPWHVTGANGEPTAFDVTGLQLTPMQMLEISRNNWEVEKFNAYVDIKQEVVSNQAEIDKAKKARKKAPAPIIEVRELSRQPISRSALVRKTDGKILDIVTPDWEPVQNHEAMDFFNEFVMSGDMEMETVGSIKGGQIVWGLAKVKESFELFKGDQIDSYLLFSNFHKYGYSTDVRFTPVRVVCNNTLCLSLNAEAERMVRYSHRTKFKPDDAKKMLGIASDKLGKYKEMATFLGSKKANPTDIVEYFKAIMPGAKTKVRHPDPILDMSNNAKRMYDLLDVQPGAKYAEGTWWQPFNAVTYFLDHEICDTPDQRLKQAWYGTTKTMKVKALELALEYAGK